MRLLYLLMFIPLAATAGEHYSTSAGPQAAIQAYSRAAHLSPLSASGEDTLRVWTRDSMLGQVNGYIITKTTAKSCSAPSSYSDGSITIGRVKCSPSPRSASAYKAIRALPSFSRQEWSCPAFDGGLVFIEGVRQHKYFAVRAGNPQVCDDPESKAIVELLGKLG